MNNAILFLFTSHQLRRGLWTWRYGRLYAGKDISGFKVSQGVGNGRQVIREGERARRWKSGIDCLRRSGASWRQKNKWETVIGKSESQWDQVNGKRLENKWEWVRRVCPILRREGMISTPRFGCCEDGHGTDEFLSWANLLPVGIWSRQRECQCFLLRWRAKGVVSDFGRRAGGWMRGFFEADFVAIST